MIDCVVAPFDQRYDAEGDEVSVTLPPSQKVVGPPAVTVGAAIERIGTVAVPVALQPFASVTCTVSCTGEAPVAWKPTELPVAPESKAPFAIVQRNVVGLA